jgi:transcriptional regulator with XRE-family HTH domain
MPRSMHELVVEELAKNKGRWRALADATGVPYYTLTKIASGAIPNPGVDHIQRLADHFGIVVLTKDEAPPLQSALPLPEAG